MTPMIIRAVLCLAGALVLLFVLRPGTMLAKPPGKKPKRDFFTELKTSPFSPFIDFPWYEHEGRWADVSFHAAMLPSPPSIVTPTAPNGPAIQPGAAAGVAGGGSAAILGGGSASRVEFRTVWPQIVRVGEWSSALVYMYSGIDGYLAAKSDFFRRTGKKPRFQTTAESAQIAAGAEIVIVPEADGVTFNPPRATV